VAHLAFDIEPLPPLVKAALTALARAHLQMDRDTAEHCERTAGIALAMAEHLCLSASACEYVHQLGRVHDIGKHRVAAAAIRRHGPLTEEERHFVQLHSRASRDVLVDLHPRLAEAVYQHHERVDGSGYPRGIGGDEMLPEAKILAVADIAEAMLSDRPWRSAVPIEDVCEQLRARAGRDLDGDAVHACVTVLGEATSGAAPPRAA
jgi:HD-GYP domain-containing protein (c-di-GMP phosphodiesterase class II)